MKRFSPLKIQARLKCDYPLLTFEQLVSTNGIGKGKTGRIPLRDYIEWRNFPNIMKRENFFTQRKQMSTGSIDPLLYDSILNYDPVFSECLAKWLLVNYKLNDYPYYDLNIVNIYTDLPQGIQICKSLMTYLKSTSVSYTHLDVYKRQQNMLP